MVQKECSVSFGKATVKYFELTLAESCQVVPQSGVIGLVQGKLLAEETTEIQEQHEKGDRCLAPLSNNERIERLKQFDNLDFNIIRINKREFSNIRERRGNSPFCNCKPLSRMTVCELRTFSEKSGNIAQLNKAWD